MSETVTLQNQTESKPSVRSLKRIVIWPGSVGRLGIGQRWQVLARHLQQQTGARLSILCRQKQDKERHEKAWGDLAEDVVSIEHVYDGLHETVEDVEKIEEKARQAEKDYHLPDYSFLMTDLLQADRHLGLAYSVAGHAMHRSSDHDKVSYHAALRHSLKAIEFFERYVETHKPDLILMEGVASMPRKALAVVARRHKIPLRLPMSRFGNLLYWVENEFYEMPWLKEAYKNPKPSSSGDANSVNIGETLARPYGLSGVLRKQFRKEFTIRGMLYGCGWEIARFIYQKMIGYRKPGAYPLSEQLSYRWRTYSRHRQWEQLCKKSFKSDKMRTIFYPLQHEPEASLSVRAPEFNNQLALIDLLSKSLPAGVCLVVKEHETNGVAARPAGFYEWLSRLPNVVMASMHENAMPFIRKSEAVAVITGTAGLEAAVQGVPVISFARRNIFNIIPHVYFLDQMSELRPLLSKLCAEQTPDAVQLRVREGKRFIDALHSCAVDLGSEQQLFKVGGHLSEAKAKDVIDRLFESLDYEIKKESAV